jgi:hypothetical protein
MNKVMPTLDILNVLLANTDWWINDSMYLNTPAFSEPAHIVPNATLWFTTPSGKYAQYGCTGAISSMESLDYLNEYMTNTFLPLIASELHVMKCTGGITNVQPKEYSSLPIFWK